jgi:hypothetical protein
MRSAPASGAGTSRARAAAALRARAAAAAAAVRAHGGPRTLLPRAARGEDLQRGASSLEFAGMLPLLLLTAMAAVQLGVAGYAVQQAGTGARAAARTAGQEDIADSYAATGRAAMSGWTASRSTFELRGGGDEVEVTTTVTIPSLIPGVDDFGDASRSATMPRD